ncbi:MAG TPA: hypothetical protein VF322_10815 [Gammaproteobacteria bacterium]
MTEAHSTDRPVDAPPAPDAPASGGDERDAATERLERALDEERKRSAALRETVEKLRFQADVLEKSYSKQLADARERAQAAEQQVAALEARLAALDTSPEDAIQLLAETRRQLDLVTAERDRLRRELARAGRVPPAPGAPVDAHDEVPDGTINRLMADPAWLREQKGAQPARLDAAVASAPDEPSEVMLAPELVFTRADKDGEAR